MCICYDDFGKVVFTETIKIYVCIMLLVIMQLYFAKSSSDKSHWFPFSYQFTMYTFMYICKNNEVNIRDVHVHWNFSFPKIQSLIYLLCAIRKIRFLTLNNCDTVVYTLQTDVTSQFLFFFHFFPFRGMYCTCIL